MDPILKNDKNQDLTGKNSSLYKLELTVALPFPSLINEHLDSFTFHVKDENTLDI